MDNMKRDRKQKKQTALDQNVSMPCTLGEELISGMSTT